MVMNKTPNCPACGRELKYVIKKDDPKRLQAFCNCGGIRRVVLETDNRDYAKNQKLLPVDQEPVQVSPKYLRSKK